MIRTALIVERGAVTTTRLTCTAGSTALSAVHQLALQLHGGLRGVPMCPDSILLEVMLQIRKYICEEGELSAVSAPSRYHW